MSMCPVMGWGLRWCARPCALYGGQFFIDASQALGGARVELRLPGRQEPTT